MADSVHWIDPLCDPRWDGFLLGCPDASVFHTREWLSAISRTYGYDIRAYTTSVPEDELQVAIPVCGVKSWLTGKRWVSVSFADHCEPLFQRKADLDSFMSEVEEALRQKKIQYVELRPLHPIEINSSLVAAKKDYCFHQLDLTPNLDAIFDRLHKDSTQRKIRRAQKEGLIYQEGQSEFLLEHFYRLFVLTRQRHGAPPQPEKWFRNLIETFGRALKIRVAFQGTVPVASILTIQFKNTLTYKYGCSDTQYNKLGGTQLLFWRSILDAKKQGLHTFDLGRSDSDDMGLITFKDRLGAARSTLTYYRCFASERASTSNERANSKWKLSAAKRMAAHAPKSILVAAGRILYKHMG